MNKNEDIAWVTRCALFDDRRAFACLVDKYQVRLKRFFLNLTGGDPVLSDDLAQETFIKVYYNLRSYKGLYNPQIQISEKSQTKRIEIADSRKTKRPKIDKRTTHNKRHSNALITV